MKYPIGVQNFEKIRKEGYGYVDVDNNVILVKGAVPGPKKSLVMIKETVKAGK